MRIQFRLPGLLLQLASQLAECSKNLIGELVLTGAGLKLDVPPGREPYPPDGS